MTFGFVDPPAGELVGVDLERVRLAEGASQRVITATTSDAAPLAWAIDPVG